MKRAVTLPAAAMAMPEPPPAFNQQLDSKRQYSSSMKPKHRRGAKSNVAFICFILALVLMYSSIHFMHTSMHEQNEILDLKSDKKMSTKITQSFQNNDSNPKPKITSDSNTKQNHPGKAGKPPITTNPTKVTAGFVHMGKTAGSTLSMLLRNGCHSFVKPKPCHVVPNETATSRLVQAYYHIPDFSKIPDSNHQIYIISVRDVYDRTISAFLYHHPGNLKANNVTLPKKWMRAAPDAYSCFPTLEKFASSLTRGNSTFCDYPYRHNQLVTNDCDKFACAVVNGQVRHFIHLFFNYKNIYSKIPRTQPEKRLMVIRKEHLWDDWWKVDSIIQKEEQRPFKEQALRPLDSSVIDSQRNSTGIILPVSADLSDGGRIRICKALEAEYRVYFEMLRRAENMGAKELEDAAKLAERNCPSLDFRSMLVN